MTLFQNINRLTQYVTIYLLSLTSHIMKTANVIYTLIVLDYIEENNLFKVIIFLDSLSVLQSINNFINDNSVIQDIILRLHNIRHKQIIFVDYQAMLV